MNTFPLQWRTVYGLMPSAKAALTSLINGVLLYRVACEPLFSEGGACHVVAWLTLRSVGFQERYKKYVRVGSSRTMYSTRMILLNFNLLTLGVEIELRRRVFLDSNIHECCCPSPSGGRVVNGVRTKACKM